MAFGMNFFRKHQAKLLIVLVVLLIVAWLVGGTLTRLLTPEAVRGVMFGREVAEQEFRTAGYGLRLTMGLVPSEDDVWTYLAVLAEADRIGITVTEEEVTAIVRQWIASVTGVSSDNLDSAYQSVLKTNRVSDDWVRYVWRQQLRAAKVREIFGGAFAVSEVERWQRFVEKNMKLALKTVALPTGRFMSEVTPPDDEQLAAYFSAHKDEYIIPPQATVEYALLLKDDIPNVVTVTDQEMREYYEDNKVDKYLLPLEEQDLDEPAASQEEASATDEPGTGTEQEGTGAEGSSDVVEPDESHVSETAEEAKDPAANDDSGADPAAVEDEASEEPSPDAEQPAETPEAEASTPGDEGGTTEPKYKPFEDVKDEIRSVLEASAVNAILSDIQADFLQSEDRDLKAIADRYGLNYLREGPFSRNEPDKLGPLANASTGRGVPVMDDIFQTAESIEDLSKMSLVEATGTDGHFLYRIVSAEAERIPELAEVADKVRAAYVNAEGEKLALAKAEEILEQLKTDGWQKIIDAGEYVVSETELTNEGIPPAVVAAAAKVEAGGFGGPVPIWGAVRVFQVLDREEPDFKSFREYEMTVARLRPLVTRFGVSTVLQFLARGDELATEAAIDIAAEEAERRAFVERWEQDLVARANIEKREVTEQAEIPDVPPDGF